LPCPPLPVADLVIAIGLSTAGFWVVEIGKLVKRWR
jgi:hypothetical protein